MSKKLPIARKRVTLEQQEAQLRAKLSNIETKRKIAELKATLKKPK